MMPPTLELRLLTLNIRDDLYALVDQNRAYLREWLPWVDTTRSPADTEAFLRAAVKLQQEGLGPQYSIHNDGRLCGVCGYHKFDRANRAGEIGYWLSEDHTGRGIMTRAVTRLIGIGFEEYALHKVEIWCGVDNLRSRAIPERLGLCYEGRIRQREFINGEFRDQAVYSILRSEYQTRFRENAAGVSAPEAGT